MEVLAYTSPARGHLNPMMPPLLELRDRGASVHLRTLSGAVESVREAGLEAEAIDPRIEAIELDDYRQKSQLKGGERTYELWARRAPFEVTDLRSAIDQVNPDLLLIDTTTFGARAAAEESGLPWAESRPFLLEDRAPGIPPAGLGFRPRHDLVGKLRDSLAYRLAGRFDRKSRLPAINTGRTAAGLDSLGSAEQGLHRAPLTLYYTAEPFEFARPPVEGVLPVGPCAWDPPAELDFEFDGRPIALVTCSSEFQNDGEIARSALLGLARTHQVVVTTAGVDPAGLPSPEGTVIRRFVPHADVLERAEVVVCHGGMGVTQKSLSFGVPVVVVPWGRDQLDVAAHVLEAEAGSVLSRKKLSPDRLARAVTAACACQPGAARVAAGYERTGGANTAADALAGLVDLRTGSGGTAA